MLLFLMLLLTYGTYDIIVGSNTNAQRKYGVTLSVAGYQRQQRAWAWNLYSIEYQYICC